MTEAPAISRRSQAIDVARAVAIVGVVANHSIDGMLNAGLIPADHPLEAVNAALYLFRMPALAFLLGLFVPRAVTKRGVAGYLRERITLMLYLYLVWFVLQGVAETVTSGLKNMPRETSALWTVWITFAHLWFLPFLIVTSLVLALLQPWRGTPRRLVVGLGLLAVSLLTWGWNSAVFGLTGLSLLAFAAAGSIVGLPRLARWLESSVLAWAAAGVAGSAFVAFSLQLDVVPATLPVEAGPAARALSLCAAVAGTIALLAVAVLLSRVPGVARLLAVIGRKTLPIYLAHVIVVAGVRVLLLRIGVDDPWVVVAVALPLGVGLPFAAASFAAGRSWAAWLFDLPAPLERTTRVTSPPLPNTIAAPNTTARLPRPSGQGAHRPPGTRTADSTSR